MIVLGIIMYKIIVIGEIIINKSCQNIKMFRNHQVLTFLMPIKELAILTLNVEYFFFWKKAKKFQFTTLNVDSRNLSLLQKKSQNNTLPLYWTKSLSTWTYFYEVVGVKWIQNVQIWSFSYRQPASHNTLLIT